MDLRTTYMDLPLKSPLVASASPLSRSLEHIKSMEDAGAGAIVLFSLYEEQIRSEAEAHADFIKEESIPSREAVTYGFTTTPEDYLNLVSQASSQTSIPIIGSLNGISDVGWIEYARLIEQAGAAALELNINYLPTDIFTSAQDVEAKYVYIVESVKAAVRIPVAVKLHPFFSSIPSMAYQLSEAGADGLVLFNRFYQPDMDPDQEQTDFSVGYSHPQEARLCCMWIALLSGRIHCSMAASGGIHHATQVAQALLAGADVVMTTSALLKNGISYLRDLEQGLCRWMERKACSSVSAMRGLHRRLSETDLDLTTRADYVQMMNNFPIELIQHQKGTP